MLFIGSGGWGRGVRGRDDISVAGVPAPPQCSGGEAGTGTEEMSESDLSELTDMLQQLGYSSELEKKKPQAEKQLKGPMAMLPITACGGLLSTAHLIYLARNQFERLLSGPLGEPPATCCNLELALVFLRQGPVDQGGEIFSGC